MSLLSTNEGNDNIKLFDLIKHLNPILNTLIERKSSDILLLCEIRIETLALTWVSRGFIRVSSMP